jgi:hypothetical protein
MKPKSKIKLYSRTVVAMITLGIAYALIFTGCSAIEEKESVPSAESLAVLQLNDEVKSRDSMINAMLTSFEQIDANLEIIRKKESKLRDYAEGEEVMGNREDRILHDIKMINTLMADNRKDLSQLREKLRKSGINLTAMETRLNHLEIENEMKVAEIDQLKYSLSSLESAYNGLNETLSERDKELAIQEEALMIQSEIIRQQDNQMNEAYFATGSFKELKERGLVERKGGVFGVVGGDKTFTANTNPEEFTLIDQRQHAKIPVFAKKVEFITPHPEGSYEIEESEDGKMSMIDITKPEDFWKSSRYLIVATN